MSDKPKSMSKKDIKAQNLAKLKNALVAGRFIDGNGKEQVIPLKADGTVSRGDLADALGFARSAFQMATVAINGARVKVESDFAVMVDKFDLDKAGKSGSEWGGRTNACNGDDQVVHELNTRIQKLEQRNATLQLERDEANAKLASLCYIDAELKVGNIRLPW